MQRELVKGILFFFFNKEILILPSPPNLLVRDTLELAKQLILSGSFHKSDLMVPKEIALSILAFY